MGGDANRADMALKMRLKGVYSPLAWSINRDRYHCAFNRSVTGSGCLL